MSSSIALSIEHPASIEKLHIYNFILAFHTFLEMSSSHRVEELWFFLENVSVITGELTSVIPYWLILKEFYGVQFKGILTSNILEITLNMQFTVGSFPQLCNVKFF